MREDGSIGSDYLIAASPLSTCSPGTLKNDTKIVPHVNWGPRPFLIMRSCEELGWQIGPAALGRRSDCWTSVGTAGVRPTDWLAPRVEHGRPPRSVHTNWTLGEPFRSKGKPCAGRVSGSGASAPEPLAWGLLRTSDDRPSHRAPHRLNKRYFRRRRLQWHGIGSAILYQQMRLDGEAPDDTTLDLSRVPILLECRGICFGAQHRQVHCVGRITRERGTLARSVPQDP